MTLPVLDEIFQFQYNKRVFLDHWLDRDSDYRYTLHSVSHIEGNPRIQNQGEKISEPLCCGKNYCNSFALVELEETVGLILFFLMDRGKTVSAARN